MNRYLPGGANEESGTIAMNRRKRATHKAGAALGRAAAGIVLLAAFAAGCGGDMQDDHARAQARFFVEGGLLKGYTLNVAASTGDTGDAVARYTNSDFLELEQPDVGTSTPLLETPVSGKLEVEFELLDRQTGRRVSGGLFRLGLKPDWRHDVIFRPAPVESDPTRGCFGCLDYHSYGIIQDALGSASPLRGDSLYVILGGNSISSPVVY